MNLCLFLGPLREDGRHELVTVFESVGLCDELEVSMDERDHVVCAGIEGPNLVADALAGLRARGWGAPRLKVEITKRIPVAGGMAGGSADAAALLRMAPQLSPVAEGVVTALAAELGADVPAQLMPGLALGTGAGETVRPLAPLAPHALAIVPTDRQLSTAEAYGEADRLGLPRRREELDAMARELERALREGARLPDELLVNDLEPAARALCPSIDERLDALRSTSADAALVCGSGPTVAGLYWGEDGGMRAEAAADDLRGRFAGAIAVHPVPSRAFGKIRSS